MAAPVIAAVSENVELGTTSLLITKPTGTASGDVLYAGLFHYDASDTITPPSGWAVVQAAGGGGQPTNFIYSAIYRKVAGGSEPADYTWTWGVSTYLVGQMLRVTGANTTTPEDGTATRNQGQSTTVTATGITTTGADRLAVIFTAGYNLPLTSGYSTWTEDNVSPDGVCYVHSKSFASAGSTGSPTASKTSDSWIASMITIASAGGATTSLPIFRARNRGLRIR